MRPRSWPALCAFLLSTLTARTQPQETYRWNSVAIGGGGYVSAVIAAPNDSGVFYARTDVGGAYRWDDAGQTWVPLMDWVGPGERGLLGIDGIAVDPKVKGRVYLLAGTSYWNNGKSMFLRSGDYGRTWEKFEVTSLFKAHGNGMGRGTGERLAVDPNNSDILFCGTRWNGLWKSSNRGATWEKVAGFDPGATPNENGVAMVLFDSNSGPSSNPAAGGASRTLYAGVSREGPNLFRSTDGGLTWALLPGQPTLGRIMPQRMALTPDGKRLYVTYGNGAGPHGQRWGGVDDPFNRGAIYRLDLEGGTWTDVSPVHFLGGLDSLETVSYGAFSGISIDPTRPSRILAASINSWRGPQYWSSGGRWKDHWGDNLFVSEDGGATWRDMFRYYWLDGGAAPDYTMLEDGGMPWIAGNTIHWIGSVVIDPFRPDRAFATSGNGVFRTDNLWEKKETAAGGQPAFQGRATWKFSSRGIEETVPLDMVSIPGGPAVSVIGDYDGFVHANPAVSPAGGRHKAGSEGVSAGTTTGIAFAAKSPNILVKVANDKARYSSGMPVNPVAVSTDTGRTWQPVSSVPAGGTGGPFHSGKVALSADGQVIAWAPHVAAGDGTTGHPGLFRTQGGGQWTASQGVDFPCHPVADPENASKFYAYNAATGVVHVSLDGARTFAPGGRAGTSSFRTMRAAPGREGHLWVPLTQGGLARSVNSGQAFAAVAGVSACEAVGFGKAAPGKAYPAIYIWGTVGAVTGVFQSLDEGAAWTRVNDDAHQYGGPANGEFVMGDADVFGAVYMSTAGRGIAYRWPASAAFLAPGTSRARAAADIRRSGRTLHLALAGAEPADAGLYDLGGRLLHARRFRGSLALRLPAVLPGPGTYVLVLRAGGRILRRGRIPYLE